MVKMIKQLSSKSPLNNTTILTILTIFSTQFYHNFGILANLKLIIKKGCI